MTEGSTPETSTNAKAALPQDADGTFELHGGHTPDPLGASEGELRLIVEAIAGFICIFSPEGELIGGNQQLLDYFRQPLEEVGRWATNGMTHPDDLSHCVESFTASLKSGEPYDFETRFMRFDGAFRWFQIRGHPLRDANGTITRWCGLLTDIDDRKRAEEALRASELDLRLTLNSIPGLVCTFTADGRFEGGNQQFYDYLPRNMETEAWATKGPVHPDDRDHSVATFRSAMITGDPYEYEARAMCHDGVYRWFQVLGRPHRGDDGRILRWYSLLIDVDDRKRAEEALRASEIDLRLTLNSIPGLVCTFTAGGRFEGGNQQFYDYLSHEMDPDGWANDNGQVHPDDRDHSVAVFKNAMVTGEPYQFESRGKCHDGVFRWFQVLGRPHRDNEGRLIRWYSVMIDVDGQKRAERALAASEQNLRLTIDTIPALAWSALPDGTADFLNQHYLDYVGHSLENLRGWGWIDFVHPEDLHALNAAWSDFRSRGIGGSIEARMKRHDGTFRWFLFRVDPLHDEAGNILKWYGVNTDIEDRKRTEAALRRSETFLSEGQRISSTGSFSWQLDTDEFTFSDELRRLFEFEPDVPVTLERIAERVHPDDLPLLADNVATVRAGFDNPEYEIRMSLPDGRIKYMRVLGRVFSQPDGRLECLGAVQDVTQRRFAEEGLHKVRSELAHVTRVLSFNALTASIAHEINQPLSGILTNASACMRLLAADPPKIGSAVETAKRTIRDGNRAAEIVLRLRKLYSKETARAEDVDINKAATEVIALASSDLQRKSVIVRTDFADDLPLIAADKVQLQQVILNMLTNAADAMSSVKDRDRAVTIRTARDNGDGILLSVHDVGAGLGSQDAEELFQPFFTTKASGMGIGLSVSRSIIESHGGRLWAAPNAGVGATFSFSVPALAEAIPAA
jgi:PAS domain S-box-containing protein